MPDPSWWSLPVWTRALTDREVSVSLVPLVLACVGLALTLAGGVWLVSVRGPAHRSIGLLLGGLVIAFATVAGAAPLLSATLLVGPADTTSYVFQPLLLVEGLILLVGGWLGGLGVAVHLGRGDGEISAHTAGGASAVGMGVLLAFGGAVHGARVGLAGPVPYLDAGTVGGVHVGHHLGVQPRLAEDAEGWRVEPVELDATAPGVVHVDGIATRGGVRLTQPLPVEVGVDRGDPLFPLVVGNRWLYEVSQESDAQLMWFISSRSSASLGTVELRVTAESEEGPLHTFTLQRTETPAPPVPDEQGHLAEPTPPTVTQLKVYRWNEGARLITPVELSAPLVSPLIARTGPSEQKGPDGEALATCSFEGFRTDGCTCLPRASGALQVPGPALCSLTTGGGAMRAIGVGLLAMFTAGLVILDTTDEQSLVLVASSGRPEPDR